MDHDALEMSEAFAAMARAADRIAAVLHRNERMNDSLPANWPISLSVDEFAAECDDLAGKYRDFAKP